ncbi:uncharacterized protein LOC117489244 isoform X2 [Trematomus bernacchii]|uniref:uncharacterized protein LOC117489244 isoform X2 n=1 Tax=Trematomus bernacchii TaxID=40690 RepID=UPI00146E2992|nr:uncharacterized protein LOC117489244 isoform X2 [Trematomus bernacchii]
MSEFRRIIMSSFLMLLLHFPAAAVKQYSRIVRAGDEVTLPFDNVIDDQDTCEYTTWYFRDSRSSVTLFEGGKIHNEAKAKSDRLRVTEKCSLVIKKVTEEDAGYYTCRQIRSGQQQYQDSQVDLSVVTMTEHQDNDEVTLRCSVSTYRWCRHTVKWLLQDQDVDKDHREIKTSQSSCSASVIFQTSHFSNTTRSELFNCEVRDGSNMQTFSPQTSGAGKVTTISTTPIKPTSTKVKTTSEKTRQVGRWRWIIVGIVGVAALTIITVAVIRRKRTQGNETQTDDNVADPEDGVSYASIGYTRKSSRKARAHLHDDDEDDAVTYSTVGAPSSSSAASADPSLLYATVNKPRKKPMKQQRSSQHVEVTTVLSH